MLPTRLRAYAVRRCAEIGIVEELDEVVDKPSLKDGLNDSWLTRRRTWDEKARTLHVSPLTILRDNSSFMPWHRNSIPRYQVY